MLLAAALLTASPRFAGPAVAGVGGEFADLEQRVSGQPLDADARRELAQAYAERGFVEEAVAAYLALLAQDREDAQARDRVRELVAERVPEWLPAQASELAPFPHAVFELKLAHPAGTGGTTSYRVLRTIQGFISAGDRERRDPLHKWPFPSSDHAYLWNPKTSRWVLKAHAYRGPQVNPSLADGALVALMCFYCVAREYLQRDPTAPQGQPINLWLAAEGQPGARAVGRDLYLYAVEVERAPAEWLREIAHEYGHTSLAGIGGFISTDDPWADGELGELLFIKWLAANGAGSSAALPWSAEEAERIARPRRQLLISAARGKPDWARLKGADLNARDYFLGLALRVEETAGPRFLAEALARCPRGTATCFVTAAEALARERELALW
jgi:hypothetical protein